SVVGHLAVAVAWHDHGGPRPDSRERSDIHRRAAAVGYYLERRIPNPPPPLDRSSPSYGGPARSADGAKAGEPPPTSSSRRVPDRARDRPAARRRAERVRGRRLLHHHVAAGPEFLHRQQPEGGRHVSIAAVRA